MKQYAAKNPMLLSRGRHGETGLEPDDRRGGAAARRAVVELHLGPKAPGPMTWQYGQYAAVGTLMMNIGFGVMYVTWRRRGTGPGRRP